MANVSHQSSKKEKVNKIYMYTTEGRSHNQYLFSHFTKFIGQKPLKTSHYIQEVIPKFIRIVKNSISTSKWCKTLYDTLFY